jgi:hypothetical protein
MDLAALTIARVSVGTSRMPSTSLAMHASIAAAWPFVIALVATGERAQLHAEIGGGRASAFPRRHHRRAAAVARCGCSAGRSI